MFNDLFNQVAIIMLMAACVGALGRLLRQPLIVSFIAVGILVGPSGLNLVTAEEAMDLLARMGISILLFLVGLRLDVHVIRRMGLVAISTGLAQILITGGLGVILCRILGMGLLTAVYVGVALTFSSTIIIVKLLSDKHEIDALHGKLAVGILIVQDLVVVLVMIGLTAVGASATDSGRGPFIAALLVTAKGAGFLVAIAALMRFIIPRIAHHLARTPELLLLSSIAWALALATVGDALGMNHEVGAFLAGVSLAPTPYREAISGRLVSLRDFLLLFFFINLGAHFDFSQLGSRVGQALALSAFVLLIKPIIIMTVLAAAGYRQRTAFLTGATSAQISEFSLIFASLGLSLGHVDPSTVGLITLIGLITIGLSTYLILHAHPIYDFIAPALNIFERQAPTREMADDSIVPAQPDIILFGLGRYGRNIARHLRKRDLRILGIDFDPQIIHAWTSQGFWAEYGDAEDPECPAALPMLYAKWIVVALPRQAANLAILKALREHGYTGRIALTAHSHDDAHRLKEAGADLVLLPFSDAAAEAADRLMSSQPCS